MSSLFVIKSIFDLLNVHLTRFWKANQSFVSMANRQTAILTEQTDDDRSIKAKHAQIIEPDFEFLVATFAIKERREQLLPLKSIRQLCQSCSRRLRLFLCKCFTFNQVTRYVNSIVFH